MVKKKELPEDIKRAVAKSIASRRYVDIKPEDVTIEDLKIEAQKYYKKFKYIPSSWLPYVRASK